MMEKGIFSYRIRDERGVTLIELIVVISVVIVLAAVSMFSYRGWAAKYKIESSVRVLYSDLMSTRARAIQRSRRHCVQFTSVSGGYDYTILDDNDPAPDGDGDCDDAGDTALPSFPKRIFYSIDPNPVQISFGHKGLADANISFRVFDPSYADVDPDYDCLIVSTTRIAMGLWDDSAGECDAK